MATRVTHSPLGLELREEQQRIVLDVLVAAAGEPVPYSRLRDAGVEFPASVIAELELAGLSVRRRPITAASHSRDPAVCLCEPAQAEAVERPPPTGLRQDPPARRSHRRVALLAIAGSIACAAVVLAVVGSPGSRGHGPPARKTSASRPAVRGAPSARPAAHRTPASRPQRVSAAPSQPHRAATLQISGHELVADGRYGQATTLLRQAMRATGMNVASCARPVGESCLVYAYALYDLGRTFLLEGRPGEAVAVLQARLEIDNQEPVVASELALARAAAVHG